MMLTVNSPVNSAIAPPSSEEPRGLMTSPERIVARMADDLLAIYRNNPEILRAEVLAIGWTGAQIDRYGQKAIERMVVKADIQGVRQ